MEPIYLEDQKQVCFSKRRHKAGKVPTQDLLGSVSVAVSDNITALSDAWTAVCPKDNLLLHPRYLKVLEQSPPQGMDFRYLVFIQEERPIGMAYFQVQPFAPANSLRMDGNTRWTKIKRWMLKQLSFKGLVCGNLLFTGEHHFQFIDSIPLERQVDLLQKGINLLRKQLSTTHGSIPMVLLKDFFEDSVPVPGPFETKKYYPFQIEPTMLLEIDPQWKTYEDYVNALSSKYRVRVKRARKKAQGIEKRRLDLGEIKARLEQINTMFQEVVTNSNFNVLQLSETYFLSFKEAFPDRFQINGYFLDGEMIGFDTTFKNDNGVLEAHFLGYQPGVNRSYQVYLNMLLDIIRQGIDQGVSKVHFARTALEIKSSVGAKAYNLNCFTHHFKPIQNRIIPLALKTFMPPLEWEERHPFK